MQTGNLLFKPKETLKDKFGGNMLSQYPLLEIILVLKDGNEDTEQ